MKKVKYFVDYFKYLNNPITALIFKFGLKKKCGIKIKNFEGIVNLTSINTLNGLMDILSGVKDGMLHDAIEYIKDIENDKEFLFIDDIKYYNIDSTHFKKKHDGFYRVPLYEYFCEDDYDIINFKDRFVIDIGANAADRTLYFAKHGANVIGFEPVKHLYKLGLDNISLNPKLKNNIIFINKAVGGRKGKLSIGDTNSTKGFTNQNDSYDIEVITLRDVLNDYNFTPDVLKMDCEGCEFEIILNEDLSMFNDIIFEHHAKLTGKDYNILLKKLKEENFKISKIGSVNDDFDEVGVIHARK